MKILVTGGAGYIGSHVCVELLNAGHKIVVVDSLVNSSSESLRRVKQLTGKDFEFNLIDVRAKAHLQSVFDHTHFDAVMHFAGLKSVPGSFEDALTYYDVNVGGTINVLRRMKEAGINKFIFSSSATVYGVPHKLPVDETMETWATNPYGKTKLAVEEMIGDLVRSDPKFSVACLRYFNPVGAHESGQIGENPSGPPANLFPYISQVAAGKRDVVKVYGDDYSTPDGTGCRDYIHVVDLAKGHLAALNHLKSFEEVGFRDHLTANLGTGRSYSVLEMIAAFEKVSGKKIPYAVHPRRAGDVAECYADPTVANNLLGWKAEKTLDDICADQWRWQSQNPDGY